MSETRYDNVGEVYDAHGGRLTVDTLVERYVKARGQMRVLGWYLDPRYENTGQICGQVLVLNEDGDEEEVPAYNSLDGPAVVFDLAVYEPEEEE